MSKPLVKYSILARKSRKIALYVFIAFLAVILSGMFGLYMPILPTSSIKFILLPIFILALIGIWIMPERHEFLEDKTRIGLYIFLGLWMVWPDYISLIRLPGDPWMSPQRIIIYTLLIFALIMFSVSKNVKHILHENYNENRWLFRALLILLFASLMSIFFSKTINYSVSEFIKDLMFNYFIFFLAATLISSEKHLKIIFLICIFSALILGLISFHENTLSQTIWSHHLPRDIFAYTEDMQKILSPRFRDNLYRVKGSSLTSLEYAELLSYILPMCLYYLFDNRGKFMKPLMIITILVIFYAIIVSRSRLGLVGAIVSMMNYSFLIAIRTWQIDRASLVGPALLTLYPALLVTVGILITSSTTLSNMILGGGGQASSTNARFDMWSKGLPLIAKQPIFGYGLGRGANELNYRTFSGGLTIDTYILQVFLETGLIGGFAFLILFSLGTKKASQIYTQSSENNSFGKMGAAIGSILMSFLFIKLVLSQQYNNTLIFFLVGIVTHYRLKKPITADQNTGG